MKFGRWVVGHDRNEAGRVAWVRSVLLSVPAGFRILDAGAGEQRYRQHCSHLRYVSQDFGRYDGKGDLKGLQTGSWNYDGIDIVSDICAIPESEGSFDAILCTEVLEHVPDPLGAIDEFGRLLRPGGMLILTAPFASLVHFAPFHFVSGFSKYWYEHHLPNRGFSIAELTPNGGWYDLLRQEVMRLPLLTRTLGIIPLLVSLPGTIIMLATLGCLKLCRKSNEASDLASLGFHCVAIKRPNN